VVLQRKYQVSKDLWEIYQTTCFVFPDQSALQSTDFHRDFAIISARNPEGRQQSDQLNQQAEQGMQQWLIRNGYENCRIFGCSPTLDYVEPSFLVYMLGKENAVELAILFRQNALFWVSDDRLYLVPCDALSNTEVDLGVFSKRLL
jgi:hypothetical protein